MNYLYKRTAAGTGFAGTWTTREIFGVNLDREVTLDTFYKALHTDDLARVRRAWRYQLESDVPCELEYR